MNKLFVYVEGHYDKMFVEKILSDFFLKEKSTILITIPYSQKGKKIINHDIKTKSKHDYLLLADLDSDECPRITNKKEKMMQDYSTLDPSKIIIVKEEIESWFLAGLDPSLEVFKNIDVPSNTDSITKEEFNELLEKNSLDKNNFLLRVCDEYDFNLAIQRNSSLNYFFKKMNC